MIDTNQYLNDILNKFKEYSISDEDKKVIKRDLIGFITQKLFRKKFRKQKLVDSTAADITNRIKLSIENNNPIHIVIFFGGYKHFWNPSGSEVDWAEVFSFDFLSDWVSAIVAVYKPGVLIEFVSEDWVLERMNNYDPKDLQKYCDSFAKLIELFNKKTPNNLTFKFTKLGDKFDKEKMLQELETKIPAGYDRWNSLSEEEKQIELKRSQRSVILKDGEGIDRVIESRIAELAYYEVEEEACFSGDYLSNPEHIYISFSFGLSGDNIFNWIVLGSTHASTVDFWVGRGILETREDGFVNRIVSKEQYAKIKNYLKMIDLDLNNFGLKNFGQIELISANDWSEAITNGKY